MDFLKDTHKPLDSLGSQVDLKKYIPSEETHQDIVHELLHTAEAEALNEAKGLD